MTIQDMIDKVTVLLKDSTESGNWEESIRFTFVLFLLQKDLILEQSRTINSLRRTA